MFPAIYLPRWLSPSLRGATLRRPGSRPSCSPSPACAAWCRSRPRWRSRSRSPTAQPFPHRDLILFITFGVIIITLVGLGLLLPSVIRWLGLARDVEVERRQEQEAELAARRQALDLGLHRLDELESSGTISAEALDMLRARHGHRRRQLHADLRPAVADLKLDLIQREREFIYRLLRDGGITDEARRRLERELDLDEAAILSRRGDEGSS